MRVQMTKNAVQVSNIRLSGSLNALSMLFFSKVEDLSIGRRAGAQNCWNLGED